jgi:hypothetical protein
MANLVESDAYYSITEQPFNAERNFISIRESDAEEAKVRRINSIQ